MKIKKLHSWNIEAKEAIALQAELAGKIVEKPPAGFKPTLVAAADMSCNRFSSTFFASVVVLELATLEVVEVQTVRYEATFPYVPGLLSFRELPALGGAFRAVKSKPDVALMDGQGRAHPRRFGLACHAGLLLDVPVIGVAKSVLIGDYKEPGITRGSFSDMVHNEEKIGEALRTRKGAKPVFISVGHKIDIETARDIVLACSPRYRLPEPARAAHAAANESRRAWYGISKNNF